MTFNDWVKTARVTPTPAGDFIFDARHDKRMPEITTLEELMKYMSSLCVGEGAHRAAKNAWRAYRRYLRHTQVHV